MRSPTSTSCAPWWTEPASGDVAIDTASRQVRFASGADYVRIQLAATPLASVITGVETGRREDLVAALTQDVCLALAPHLGPEGLTFPQEVRTVLARA